MRLLNGLLSAVAILIFSSGASAHTTNPVDFVVIQHLLHKNNIWDEQQYRRENPRDCYSTYIGGRKNCFVL